MMYMVSITLSSDTRGLEVRRRAMREALTAFMAAMALRSMQGTCTWPGHRVAGQTQVVFHADLGGFTDMLGAAAHQLGQAGGGHGAGDAHFTLAAHFGAGDGRVHLVEHADGGSGQIEAGVLVAAHRLDELVVVGQHRGMMPAAPLVGAVTTRPPAAFSSLTCQGEHVDPVHDVHGIVGEVLVGGQLAVERGGAARYAQRAGEDAPVRQPRSIPSRMVVQILPSFL